MAYHLIPKRDHVPPKTESLEHEHAGRDHHHDIQDRSDASRHGNVVVDKPQDHSDHDQRQNQVCDSSDVFRHRYVFIDELRKNCHDDCHNGQGEDEMN